VSGGDSRIEGAAVEFSPDGAGVATVRFSVRGAVREAFNEEGWSAAYAAYDNTFKLKYGVRVYTGSTLKKTLGREVDSYRKASIFWTRNPKLVNPMKDKRIWVQVAKNFEPFIPLTVEGVRAELFDFEEKVAFDPAELGPGTHKVGAEVRVSWQKHTYVEPGNLKAGAEAALTIN
jgi:hypothetical protein